MSLRRALALSGIVLGGCTFSPGGGFATLRRATVEAALVPGPARDLGDGAILTDEGFAVTIERLEATLASLTLVELVGARGEARFDPANPPPGYTLCHGGHCHAVDGGVASYAEIELELAGGAASFEPVVELPLDEAFDLLAGTTREPPITPSPELPRARLSRAQLGLDGVVIVGSAVPWPGEGDAVALDVALPLSLEVGVDLPLVVDRSTPPRLVLEARLAAGGALLDGLDFVDLALDGALRVRDAADPGAAVLIENLRLTDFTVHLEEEP